MPITVNNFGKFRRDMELEQRKRLTRAAIVGSRRAKELLSVSGTGVWQRAGNGVHQLVKAVKNARNRVYGAFPSMPGEPPHKQTGHLRRSVTYEVTTHGGEMVSRYGTNVKYGRWLEEGTTRMAPRPWLRRSFAEMGPQIRSILTAPWMWRA